MHSVVRPQVFLVQPQLHKKRDCILAVQGVTEYVHCLLELRRTDIGCQLVRLSLLLGQELYQAGFIFRIGLTEEGGYCLWSEDFREMGDTLPLTAFCCHQIGLKALDEVNAEYPSRLALDFSIYFLWLLYLYLL